MRKAERSVDKGQDDLARAALDRYQTSQRLALSYREQVDDQKAQVEALKGALMKLEQKLDEAKSKRELLLARHRRSIALGKAARSQTAIGDHAKSATFDRLKDRVNQTEAIASAEVDLSTDDVAERLTRIDRDVEVEPIRDQIAPPPTRLKVFKRARLQPCRNGSWINKAFAAEGFFSRFSHRLFSPAHRSSQNRRAKMYGRSTAAPNLGNQ
jgi:hypothetical protein